MTTTFRVLLKPDGLEFIVPATLTVTGNGIEGDGFIADHSGMDPVGSDSASRRRVVQDFTFQFRGCRQGFAFSSDKSANDGGQKAIARSRVCLG